MNDQSTRPPERARLVRLLARLRAKERGDAGFPSFSETALEQLTNESRPPLFSRMPRMLRDDGRTAEILPAGFRYIQDTDEIARAATVSPAAWHRARATSRLILRRRRRTPDTK